MTLALLLGAFLVTIGVVTGAMVPSRTAQARAAANMASASSPCVQPAVLATERTIPDTTDATDTVAIPAGEPAVVARVNGIPITATQFEAQVAGTQRTNQQTLSTLPADAPAVVRAGATQTTTQLRQSVLRQMIMSILWLEAGKHAGVRASDAQAQAGVSAQHAPHEHV